MANAPVAASCSATAWSVSTWIVAGILEPARSIRKRRPSCSELASYTETSPSGTGVHVLVHGELPPGRRRKGSIEMYADGRYFAMTGDHLDGTPTTIEMRSAELVALHRRIFGPPDPVVVKPVSVCDDHPQRSRNSWRSPCGRRTAIGLRNC